MSRKQIDIPRKNRRRIERFRNAITKVIAHRHIHSLIQLESEYVGLIAEYEAMLRAKQEIINGIYHRFDPNGVVLDAQGRYVR